jgi:hypothetical protein
MLLLKSMLDKWGAVHCDNKNRTEGGIDGCIRTYYLGKAVEGKRSFPIELAQIGAVIICRLDNGQVQIYKCGKDLFLLPYLTERTHNRLLKRSCSRRKNDTTQSQRSVS